MKLERVVPFGRSLDEYRKIFNLSKVELAKNILGVGDGPASFNMEMLQQGHVMTSVDPLYELTSEEIRLRFYQVVEEVMQQVENTPENWVWKYHKSPEDLRANRERALEKFGGDYDRGKQEGRYRIGELPHLLGIEDRSFDLALCSHFLFLYSDQFDGEFHRASILEMLRVATEIRVFPLLTLGGEQSRHVKLVIQELESNGFKVGIRTVSYELQRGGNKMLWAKHP